MAHIAVHRDDLELESPTLVEGLPGVGLVGKIAADHLVETFEMTEYASIHCDGLPEIAVYRQGDQQLKPPVRLYADAERELLVLQSDAPVSPSTADEFATCLTGWLADNDVTPIYLSGMPAKREGTASMYGVGTGDGKTLLSGADIGAPTIDGAVTGPTGALLHVAQRQGLDSVGLVVEADKQFPDPAAARVVLQDGVQPLAGIDIDTEVLVEHAEEISEAKADLAAQMQQANDESTSAKPLGMFQ
ncbi:proteasome assembly chaperone family protein [Halomicrobium sp. HM KBTZ05]|uniref:Proteasome assembly chaperone family protein n=1 Tax=Halomicrobium mukohataei TaxID=57705 RepID=A0A847UFY1_9EURY|nr:PAC2 family protein [Halomicrobium mukohataei]NLV11147.1 proteasome assembly chaperone family protein [Halomicrobium mukohataei]